MRGTLRRGRIGPGAGALLGLALAGAAGAAPRVETAVRAALEQGIPAEGLAVGVVLRDDGLPLRRGERRAEVAARQQAVLDALPPGSFRLRRRYRQLAGLALWAREPALDALMKRTDAVAVYVDGTVHASMNQGRPLVGADTVHGLGFTGAGIKVAVLDSGIDVDHVDLVGDIAAQHCFCDDHPSPAQGCCPGGDDEETGAADDDGHGTSVSGIVTATGVISHKGIAPDAEIVAVKVLDANGSGSFSDIAAGLDWVLDESALPGSPVAGVRVVNLSLGDGGEYASTAVSPCSGTNTAAAIAALHAAGIAVFAASGNESHDAGISFPACVAEAISVGGVYDNDLGQVVWCEGTSCATTCTDFAAPDVFVCHTNSGSLLDLVAPDWITRTTGYTGGIVSFGGTSAASPYAAAQAALLFQIDPELGPEDVRSLLRAHGPQVLNPDNGLSFPRTDVGGAAAQVLAAFPSAVVFSLAGADFQAGGSTAVAVEVRDGGGNLVADDDTTQITFTPGGSAAVTAVTTGSGDGSYGVPGGAETLTVAGGQASVVLTDLVAETFAVDVANDAGLANPPADSIQVSAAAAAELVLALPGADFAAGGATAIVVEVRDAFGNTLAGDGVTQVGFAPSGSAAIAAVTTGSGDGSYGVPGGAETLTVAGGVAAVSLTDLVAESVAVAFSNDAGVASPPADSIEVSAAAADRVVLVQAGADFEVGGGTTLSVQVQDAFGNPVVSDEATGIGFAPSGSGTIADVTTGTGDGSYGVPGGSETVQVAGGAATIALTDPVAETFEVTFSNDAGLSNPESDAIAVSRSDGGVPPAPVPSSGPFGLLVLGGLLVGTALRRVRQLHRRAGRPA